MDAAKLVATFNERKRNHNIHFAPKDEQIEIAINIFNGLNTLGFLPTGFGKTLCFVINSIISEKKTITLIISPLLSLMEDQINTFQQWNLSCAKIAHDTSPETCNAIAEGKFLFVFASPESVLKPVWRRTFMNHIWQARLSLVVFDEAHCLTEWGEDFRPDYAEMAQLRSFFKVPILAVTATCTKKVRDGIMTVLQLDPNRTKIISKSSNRNNIKIVCYKKSSPDIETEFNWLISHFRQYGQKAKKVLIYCRSIDAVSLLFISLKAALGVHAYANLKADPEMLLIEMFHKCTHESSKARILRSFVQGGSTIRCVIATVALGMGVDIRDVDMVVHYGCPTSVVSYWQEAGRCARDGRRGMSVIIYDNLTASLRTTDTIMSYIVRHSHIECIRKNVMNVFAVADKENFDNTSCNGCSDNLCKCESCNCCSFCATKCSCNKCSPESTVETFINM